MTKLFICIPLLDVSHRRLPILMIDNYGESCFNWGFRGFFIISSIGPTN